MFLGYFCSSRRCSTQALQIVNYFITFTLHNVYPQHGCGNTEHKYYLAVTPLSPYLWVYIICFLFIASLCINKSLNFTVLSTCVT